MAAIEEFLLEQLGEAIKETKIAIAENKSCDKSALSKLLGLHEECKTLKELIEDKKPGTGASFDTTRREKLYYLNNIMTEVQLLLKQQHLLAPETIKLACDLRGRVQQIRKDLLDKKIKDDSVQGGMKASLPKDPQEIYRWSSRSALPKYHGIEDKAMVMERLLVDKEGFKAIGIVGRAGVGKTAICQKAFNEREVKQHFIPRIWASLSKQSSGKVDTDKYRQDLVKRILMCLGFEDNVIDRVGGEGGLCRLLFALRQQLNRRRYLIVLDDVWDMEGGGKNFFSSLIQDDEKKQTDQLGHGLPKKSGGAVIITSRSGTLAKSTVGEKNLHRLLPLLADRESCWKIFIDAAGDKDETERKENTEKQIIRNEILRKCAGLPLTARMLGQIQQS